jgi:PTH1 family peptidyl-tRNA hydrolase
MVLDEIGRRHGGTTERERSHCLLGNVDVDGVPLTLAWPVLFMNRSGPAVRALLASEGAEPGEALVICDDLAVPFGALRLRRQGSHGGHNGLRSIIEALDTREFPRLRVGIGPAGSSSEHVDFVLGAFPPEERERLPEVIGAAADCALSVVRDGLEQAMNRFNRKPGAEARGAGPIDR